LHTDPISHPALSQNSAAGGAGGGAEGGGDGTPGTGGKATGGGVAIFADLTVTDSTIAANASIGGAPGIDNDGDPGGAGTGQGGGLWRSLGTATIRGTITAGNSATGGAANGADAFGSFTSGGYNLIQNTSGAAFTGSTFNDITGVNPQLGTLSNNGGPTDTMALAITSAAIDKGHSFGLTNDQRGLLRIADGVPSNPVGGDGTDIGAFEFHPGGGADADGDGMPDDFESFYGVSDPDADADGDGQTNLQESLAGTNPRSIASALRAVAPITRGSDLVITFEAVAYKTYRLERKLALTDAFWQSIAGVADLTPQTTGITSIAHPGGASQAQGFYRVRLLP